MSIKRQRTGLSAGSEPAPESPFPSTYHTAAAGVAGVLQVVVQQFGGSVLERFGQSSQQHGELGGVELKQSDQHHLGRLEVRAAG